MSAQFWEPPRSPRAAFEARRARLLAELEPNGLESICLPSGFARPRNFAHNLYPFRAESHFLYFTGRHLEGALFVVEDGAERLYVLERDAEEALWSGPPPTYEELSEELGLDVRPLGDFEPRPRMAMLPPQDEETALWLSALLDRTVEAQSGPELVDADEALAQVMVDLRIRHDACALEQLRFAADESGKAHEHGMRSTRHASREYQVRAQMEARLGESALRPAYGSIVTMCGEVLHQPDSGGLLGPGLLLCDVGGETPEGFAGDVTRTWPTSGPFSGVEREAYEAVLRVQLDAIAGVRAGVSYGELHERACLLMAGELVGLGLLDGAPRDLFDSGALSVFFPHGLGHLLGLDVHDMEDLGDRAGYGPEGQRANHPAFRALRLNRVLEPDMVVTIEPGLYFSPLLLRRAKEDRTISRQIRWTEVERFRGVRGIRIEDDVLVTGQDPVVLSASAPKSVPEIEACLGA